MANLHYNTFEKEKEEGGIGIDFILLYEEYLAKENNKDKVNVGDTLAVLTIERGDSCDTIVSFIRLCATSTVDLVIIDYSDLVMNCTTAMAYNFLIKDIYNCAEGWLCDVMEPILTLKEAFCFGLKEQFHYEGNCNF